MKLLLIALITLAGCSSLDQRDIEYNKTFLIDGVGYSGCFTSGGYSHCGKPKLMAEAMTKCAQLIPTAVKDGIMVDYFMSEEFGYDQEDVKLAHKDKKVWRSKIITSAQGCVQRAHSKYCHSITIGLCSNHGK